MRAPVVEAARQAQIDMMDRGDRHSFEDVLTAMLMPIIHVFSARDRMLYARFMMRLLPLDEDEHPYFKALHQIGSASCRERVCQYVKISVVAVSLKKNILHPHFIFI